MYTNISDQYGEQVSVSVEDYRELNPDGEFIETFRVYGTETRDVIVEIVDGRQEIVAMESDV